MKYIKISIVILLVSFISIFAYKLTTNNSNNKISLTKEQMKEMLSYTIDGNSTNSMPSKGSGYKVKSITCKNGSILSWDNDNWLLEVEKLESEDLCNIDFTTGTGSYTVTAVPSIAGSLDSTFKTTTENGQVTFYTDLVIDSVSGCTNEISDGKVIVKNVTGNTTCNINVSYMKLYDKLLSDNPTINERTDFTTPFTTNTVNTLYKAKEDNTDVYYFAGIDGMAGHCVYDKNGKSYTIRKNGSEVSKEECSSTLTLCDSYIWTGTQDECENPSGQDGTYHQEDVYWVDTVSKPINNWVKFGKNASNQDLYWRIIRTNSDGGVRLLYHGTSTTATDAYIGTSTFNSTYNDSMYAGYMYGTSGSQASNRTNTNNSTIKTAIDNWYASNMTSYTKYLSTTAVYCNDREVGSRTYSATGSTFYYAARTRLDTNKIPIYTCTNTDDKFTVDSSAGNGKLTHPIALMTADEVAFAGGLYGATAPMWYYTNSSLESSTGSTYWWLLSPDSWDGNVDATYVFGVSGSSNPGRLGYSVPVYDNTYGVRPVISLKSDVLYKTGDGSANSPYEIMEFSELSEVVKANAVNENGYRYEGTDPNNYIQMKRSDGKTEMWRIIGLFPDGENGEDVIRVRKVREEYAPYDSKCTNHWPNTTLYTSLKDTYSLTNYKNTVNYKIYLGALTDLRLTAEGWYTAERGSTPGATSKYSYSSVTQFYGSVGLIYPSDYGYAVLASDCARTKSPSGYDSTAACYNNNWLYQGASSWQWLISPVPDDVCHVYFVFETGRVGFSDFADVTQFGFVSPVMALKADVEVTGSGTQSNPYIMK